MAVTDFFAGEIATELIKLLVQIVRKSIVCKSSAEQLKTTIEELVRIIEEINFSNVEFPEARQFQLDRINEDMKRGTERCRKIMRSSSWNARKNLQYARKLDKIDKARDYKVRSRPRRDAAAQVSRYL